MFASGWILIGDIDYRSLTLEFTIGQYICCYYQKTQETGHEGITKVIVDESGNLEAYLF